MIGTGSTGFVLEEALFSKLFISQMSKNIFFKSHKLDKPNTMIEIEEETQLIDKDLVTQRFKSVINKYSKNAVIQKEMAERLVNMSLFYLSGSEPDMLELGCGTGILTKEIVQRYTFQRYTANDLVREFEPLIADVCRTCSHAEFSFIAGDAEHIDITHKQDVIWSGATIQWITDLESLFSRIRKMLKPKGYFIFSSFERYNYFQIKQLTGNGIQYKRLTDVLEIAAKNFRIEDYQVWQEDVWFDSPRDVLKHIQDTGVNAVKCEKWTKTKLTEFTEGYEKFKGALGYPLTYHPVLVILQAK